MKRLFLPVALALSLSLGGCAYLEPILHPTDTKAQLIAEKALVAAHDAHDLFAIAASAAAKSGACVATCAVQVKSYLDDSETILLQADAVSDADTIGAKIAAAIVLIDKGKALLQ